ncbi:hypothetical protein [Enterobacter cloacae]|uniref:hypothetical protein n=1 Tax=Enterobacter cloacae TaxID=550 RepID=UPI0021C1FF8C|nr:hypothetical protein [Enterobacter cloacae]MDH0438700.1 hypothetical protein [Enterobacter cloacae]UXL10593.1 hypothetical protein N7S94_00825 [Enterobacter cloacae]
MNMMISYQELVRTFPKKTKTPNINDLIVVKNRYNKYALIKILAIKESTSNVKGIEVEIEYAINSTGGVNFS